LGREREGNSQVDRMFGEVDEMLKLFQATIGVVNFKFSDKISTQLIFKKLNPISEAVLT
jgi:hypothetical protein